MKKSILALSLAASISLNAAVVAVVNGKKIDDSIFGSSASQIQSLPAEAKKAMIDRVIVRQLLLEEAKKAKVQDSPEYKLAAKQGEENLAIQVWEKQQFDAIKISDSEAKDFYNKNKDKTIIPAQVRAKHILVASKAEAEAILKELKGLKGEALNKKFSELASTKSIDKASGANGGELGFFPKSQMVPEFADAAFAMKKGEISKAPVQTNFGFHIILKEDERAQSTLTFNRVKDDIINTLKTQKLQVQMQKKVEDLRKNAKIEYK